MPELPEAEVVAGQLRARTLGATIHGYWLGRRDIIREGGNTIAWYCGTTITGVERVGKSIMLACRKEQEVRYVVAELGMTGLLLFEEPARLPQHTHLILSLAGQGASTLRYWNPRRFGRICLLDSAGRAKYTTRRFGYDPLSVTMDEFCSLVRRCRGRLKPLLMHQQKIAGIGNIYSNEILHRARLHPNRIASQLSGSRIEVLYRSMQEILTDAIKEGGSSVRDFMAPDASQGRYTEQHRVYNKSGRPCTQCGRKIRRLSGDRSSFYCPSCQRL